MDNWLLLRIVYDTTFVKFNKEYCTIEKFMSISKRYLILELDNDIIVELDNSNSGLLSNLYNLLTGEVYRVYLDSDEFKLVTMYSAAVDKY